MKKITCLSLYLFCFVASAPAQVQVILARQEQASNAKTNDTYRSVDTLQVPPDLQNPNWVKFEGPAWENPDIAYRLYADTRHRTGVIGKRKKGLVLKKLNKIGTTQDEPVRDILYIGESLGLGSPAFYVGDSAQAFTKWREKSIVVTENTPESLQFEVYFKGLESPVGLINLTQTVDFFKDSRWTKISLFVEEGYNSDLRFCTGLVKNPVPTRTGKKANAAEPNKSMTWLATYGKQSTDKSNLGLAIAAADQYGPEMKQDRLNLLMAFDSDFILEYFFMAAWEQDRSGVTNLPLFEKFLKSQLPYAQKRVRFIPPRIIMEK